MNKCQIKTEPYPCFEPDGHDGPHRSMSGLHIDVYRGDDVSVSCACGAVRLWAVAGWFVQDGVIHYSDRCVPPPDGGTS